MSDYGSMILLTKKSEPTFSDADKELLSREIEKIKNENEFFDALGENFNFIVTEGVGKDYKYLVVILSQYWGESGEEEATFELAKENDLAEAGKIAEKLAVTFGQTFEIKPVFENW